MSNLSSIDTTVSRFIQDKQMYVLRDATTGNALNSSYTEDGLKWTTNASGKLVYFNNAHLKTHYNSNYEPTMVTFEGDTSPSSSVIVEKFVPVNRELLPLPDPNHKDYKKTRAENSKRVRGQIAEYTWIDKSYRLLYHTS
jgi:hypothetical protein